MLQKLSNVVYGIDLSKSLTKSKIKQISELWKKYPYLVFPNQILSNQDLELLVTYFGDHLKDPFIKPIDGTSYVARVLGEKDETSRIFADTWHKDWFHMRSPPKATALYAIDVPKNGGDTLFADQYKAYKDLPLDLKKIIDNHSGVNSAKGGYSPEGVYGRCDTDRSMDLFYNDSAYETQIHPLMIYHPVTKNPVINCNPGYTIGIKGMGESESRDILDKIFDHQTKDKYVYRHKWTNGDFVLWDNRCLLHKATGGYQGSRRLLHRITIK